MEKIRIQNLRCLADTGHIEIKPITLLVGSNSSGKSSFLRVFPLLRQSAEMRTLSGLLLNEGDVNFGFFNEAIHRDAEPAELKLTFGLTLKQGLHQGAWTNRFLLGPQNVECEISYARRTKDQRYPFLRSVKIKIKNENYFDLITIEANEEGEISKYQVNAYQASGEVSRLRLRVGRGLMPRIVDNIDSKDGPLSSFDEEISEVGIFERKLIEQTYDYFHGRTGTGRRLAIFDSIRIGSPELMLESIQSGTGIGSWDYSVKRWTVECSPFRNFRNLLLAKATSALLSGTNSYLSQLAASVHYFQPVRASVQRDYLSRDVQVGSVDPTGLNVAMVLSSLRPAALLKFREWMLRHFGFEVFPQIVSDGARVSLRMREANTGVEFNLADMGFGFSQMLPFLVQIWNIIEEPITSHNRYSRKVPTERRAIAPSFIIAIEQPELHLHPALQARLADVFVTVAKISREQEIPIRFILETHSPTIIERIGALVEEQQLKPDDVQVLLFERGSESGNANTATVRSTEFDEQGIIKDWPFGFLSPPLAEMSRTIVVNTALENSK